MAICIFKMISQKLTKQLPGAVALALFLAITSLPHRAAAADDNAFPTPAEVFQGRNFATENERAVFFLHAIHDRYPQHWQALVEANINEQLYIQAPDKMIRFINQLAEAMVDNDDPTSIASLRAVTTNRLFYTNINAYHPEVLRAAARALIKIGPAGRKALAEAFSESHYRDDSESLSELAKTVGDEKPADPELTVALSATAFGFSTSNGGIYPRYTTEAVKNLLLLPQGPLVVKTHLNTNEILADPVRFQSIVDGIAASHSIVLITNLSALNVTIGEKLVTLKAYPGAYRDALEELHTRIQNTTNPLGVPKKDAKQN